eukprot:6479513-Amphidinium_carterae.1
MSYFLTYVRGGSQSHVSGARAACTVHLTWKDEGSGNHDSAGRTVARFTLVYYAWRKTKHMGGVTGSYSNFS